MSHARMAQQPEYVLVDVLSDPVFEFEMDVLGECLGLEHFEGFGDDIEGGEDVVAESELA